MLLAHKDVVMAKEANGNIINVCKLTQTGNIFTFINISQGQFMVDLLLSFIFQTEWWLTSIPLESISFKKGAKKLQLHEIVRKFAHVVT